MRGWIAAASLLLCLPTSAAADDDDRRRAGGARISEAQAIRIARGYGMVRIQEIEREDGGWEIDGRDHRGRQLEVKINRRGRVTSVERGD